MEYSIVTTARPCFIEEDDGLASLANMGSGFSGSYDHNNNNMTQIKQHHHLIISRPLCYSRKTSNLRNFSFPSTPRSGRFFDARFEGQQHHFLHACFLCKKQLGHNKDIFMYRGDTPFCSEECRQVQIETDEAKEKKCNLKTLRNKNDQVKPTNSASKKDYVFRAGAVAAS